MRNLYIEDVITIGFVLLVVLLSLAASIALVQEIRSEPARIECRTKRMDSMRPTLSSKVTCVPFPMRQDTLTVK